MLNRRSFLKWTGAIATTALLDSVRPQTANVLRKPRQQKAEKKTAKKK